MLELFKFKNTKSCTINLVCYTGGTKSSGKNSKIFAQTSFSPDTHRKLLVETLLSEGHIGAFCEDFAVAEDGSGENQHLLFRA